MKHISVLFAIMLVAGFGHGKATIPKNSDCYQEDEYFHPGKSYLFNYEVVAVGRANETSNNPIGRILIRCDVHLSANGNCHYILKVNKCILHEGYEYGSEHVHQKSKQFSAATERYPIEFTLSNGYADYFLAHEGELLSILNFKRGIITSLITKRNLTNQGKEQRTDIHGTCQVKYSEEYDYSGGNSIRTIVMVKNIEHCLHPRREYWRYNPSSLTWNRPLLSTQIKCHYKFNSEGNLANTNCVENYSTPITIIPTGSNSIAPETFILINLTLTKESSFTVEDTDKTSYIPHSIKYEHEESLKPKQNLEDFETTVESLVESLATDPEKPIHAHDVNAFDKLLVLLRNSSDLSVPNRHFGKVMAQRSKFTNLDIQRGQIWRDALIQCKSSPCTRAFKAMLDGDSEFVKYVVSKPDLENIFSEWKEADINDFEQIKDILAIAKQNVHSRYIILDSSIILNNYWILRYSPRDETDQANFDQVLKTFLSHIEKSFDEECVPNEGFKDIDVIAALKALTNIVPIDDDIAKEYLNVIEKCIYSKKAHWFISSVATEVTKGMKKTPQLYNFLLKIFQDPNLTHTDRVTAYILLADKFGNTELIDKLLEFLVKVGEKGYDYNLRTFILTHMRTISKASYSHGTNFRYRKAIRKAMVYNSSLFRAIPEEISPRKDGKPWELPWRLHLDDDLIFEAGHFSKYSQKVYNYNSPLFKRFGYEVSRGILHNDESYLPFAKWVVLNLHAFERTIPGFELSFVTKGMTKVLEAMASPEATLADMHPFGDDGKFTNYLHQLRNSWENIRQSSPHFPYNVDSIILKSLEALRKSRVEGIPKSDEKMDLVGQFGLFSNSISLTTLEEIRALLNHMTFKFVKKLNIPYPSTSQYWKFIEGITVIPTFAGIPIDYTTDAYFINNLKLHRTENAINGDVKHRISIDGSFSGLATVKLAMQFDMKGFASFGIQHVSTISSSWGATVSLDINSNPTSIKTQLELPQRPQHILRLTRNISLIKDHEEVYLPEDDMKSMTKTWCSYTLASILGFKLCHSNYFVPTSPDKPCPSLARNSYWDYTADYVAKHKVALQLGIETEDDGYNQVNTEIFLKNRDQTNSEKFNTLAKLSHTVKIDQRRYDTKISIPALPTFNIHVKAKKERFPEDGLNIQAEATVYPGQTTYIDYLKQSTTAIISESSIGNHMAMYTPSSKLAVVPITTILLNYTSLTAYYGYSATCHKFATMTSVDHQFHFKSSPHSKNWVTTIFNHPSFWENDGTAWVKIRNEVKEGYDHQYYSHVKLPKTTVKFTAFHGPVSLSDQTLNFNLTKHDPITDDILKFVNFASSIVHTTKDGKLSYIMKANFTLPSTSMEVELRKDNISPTNTNYTFTLRKEEPYYKERFEPWYALSEDMFEHRIGSNSKISSFQTNFHVNDQDPFMAYMPMHTPFIDIGDIGMKEFHLNVIYHEDERHKPTYELDIQSAPPYGIDYNNLYSHNLSISIPTENFRFDSILNIFWQKLHLQYKAKFGSSYDQSYYTFNITPSKNNINITEDLKSDTYKNNMQLILIYTEAYTGNLPYISLDITSQSEIEPIWNFDMTLKHDDNKTSMEIENEFVIIDMDSNSEDEYTDVINFKSKNKNMVPNMRWQLQYPKDEQGTTIKLDFPDVHELFYIFAHTELNATTLVFRICRKENCTASDHESSNFVAEIELSLENPEKITRTVIYNSESLNFIGVLVRDRLIKITRGLHEYFTNPAREKSPLKESIITTREKLKDAAREASKFFLPFIKQCIVSSGSIFDFLFRSVTSAGKHYILGPIEHLQQSRFSWCTYEALDVSIPSRPGLGDSINQNRWYQPGPIPGESFVDTIPLPVYWTQFNQPPVQWSPTFAGKFQKLREQFTNIGTSRYRENFQDANYTRHAFFSDSGRIYTFDGRIIELNQSYPHWCSYLLSHDFDTMKFTIYYRRSSIHFLFPDLKLTIAYSGTVEINETSHIELPFANWNENIQVTRQADFIELNTPYHLKVICKYKPFYCIFYTNLHKFNKLIGLLGNNNDNPSDDSDDEMLFELFGENCSTTQLLPPPHLKTNCSPRGIFFNTLFWDDESSTLPCHSIIAPIDFLFVPCYNYDRLQKLIDGYVALCSAKNVPVGRSPLQYSNFDESYEDWKGKVEDGIDVIFILNLEYLESPEQFINGMKKLADAIVRQWQSVGQTNVSFGLVGYEGKGYRHKPQQQTMNGALLGTYEEFVNHGLKSLRFDGPRQHKEYAALDAVEHAVDYYSLREKSQHVFIVVTPLDPPATQGSRTRKLVQNLLYTSGTLHLLSDFGVLENDYYDFADEERKYQGKQDFPKGVLTSLAAATEGSIWQFAKLEVNSDASKDFAKIIASKIYGNGEVGYPM